MIKQYCLILLMLGFSLLNAQTIPAPDLQCVTNNAVSSNVILSWTNQGNPCGGAFNGYRIYISPIRTGPYTLVTTINTESTTTFTDLTRLSGGQTWFYYMEADYNCPGLAIAQSDTVQNSPPATPNIINVDVQPDNSIVFNWEVSPSPQTHSYRVYYLPGIAVPINDVTGRFNTTYIDGADPSLASVRYTVSASDSCGTISSYNENGHRTIFLTYSTSSCERSINLNWTRYENWPQGVKEYRILVSRNQAPFVETNRVDSAVQTFTYSGFNDGDTLCITVEAVSAADTNITSHSNYQCFRPSIVQSPDYIYLINATVDLDNKVNVTWLTDPAAELLYYQVDVSGNGTQFDFKEQFLVPSPLTPSQDYVDSTSFPQNNALFYRVRAVDSCNLKFNSVDSIKTVNLTGELFDYYVANIVWNDFVAHGATILYWNLYRDNNDGAGYQLIKTFPAGVNETSDSLQAFLNEKGIFCYRIEAVYDIDLPGIYRDTLSSFSNQFCLDHRPIIYIPNAFAPYGINNVFKPTIIFGSPQNYSMTIWNRWGAKIFESTDPDLGWDGTQGGTDVQMGAYAYLIKFVASDGVNIERKGMVLLVK